ncbi:threonylcarbamoyladenosine tRNA methylthiotransferase [Tanacetum coccineum]
MAGQLSAFAYVVSENAKGADLWLINTCTVKSPIQSSMDTLISKCKSAKKPLVVAGCVPQGSRDLKDLKVLFGLLAHIASLSYDRGSSYEANTVDRLDKEYWKNDLESVENAFTLSSGQRNMDRDLDQRIIPKVNLLRKAIQADL